MIDKDQTLKTSYLLFRVMDKYDTDIDRENLKIYMKKLRDKCFRRKYLIEMDFIYNGPDLYSNRFNEVIDFGLSSNIITEKLGSVMYSLTSRGKEFIKIMPNEFSDILTPDFLKIADEIIKTI